MTTPAPPPPRVRVTSTRREPTTAHRRPVSRELDEQTPLGGVYLGGLMWAQLRLSLLTLGIAFVAIGGLPVLLRLVPATARLSLAGFPFPWLVLGVLVYPVVFVLGRWYVRQAERIEADFADVVDPS